MDSKLLLSCIVLYSCCIITEIAAASTVVNYDITYLPEGSKLESTLEYRGDGISRLQLIESNIKTIIENVKAPEGIKLSKEYLEPNHYKIHYNPNDPIQISYDAKSNLNQNYYFCSPYIGHDGFHLLADSILLFPSDLYQEDHDNPQINITFNIPAEYAFFANAANKKLPNNKYLVQTNRDDIADVVFASLPKDSGNIHKLNIESNYGSKSVDLIFFNVSTKNQELFKGYMKKIFETQRNLFGKELDFDYSFIILQSHGYFNSYRAKHLNENAIIQIFSESLTDNLNTIAHEHLHSIFTHYKSISSKLFSEGFLNYYANKTLLMSGIYNLQDYIREYNIELRQYYQNSDSSIATSYLDSKNILYQRGHILAQELDEQIKMITGGAKSLDDVVKTFLIKHKKDSKFSMSLIKEAITEVTNHELNNLIDVIGEQGAIEGMLSKCIMECQARLYIAELKVPDYGFNFSTLSEGEIMGLEKDSNAYKAGLRMWQEFVRDETPEAEKQKEGARTITLVVKDHTEAEKTITYTTGEKTIKVPQYKLGEIAKKD